MSRARITESPASHGDPCLKRGGLKAREVLVQSKIPWVSRSYFESLRIEAGEREVQMRQALSVDLLGHYPVAWTVADS